jgi:hypothetical protein
LLYPTWAGRLPGVKGFVLVLVVEASQAADDHEAIARVCHDFDANTIGDLEVALELAAKSAKRQLRRARDVLRQERDVLERRGQMRLS